MSQSRDLMHLFLDDTKEEEKKRDESVKRKRETPFVSVRDPVFRCGEERVDVEGQTPPCHTSCV
jgi:hypothetical protein